MPTNLVLNLWFTIVSVQFHNLMTTSKDQMNNNAQKVYMGFKPRAAADVGPKT